jgi:hypothetical protein
MATIFLMNKEIARGMVCFFHQKKHSYLILKMLYVIRCFVNFYIAGAVLQLKVPGANNTIFEFTATYNASVVVGQSVFQSILKYFCFQNTLGYPLRCKNLQRWRCNSQS